MSMKSFDKFCERMILAEPGSEKEIFDERQNQQRSALTIEALVLYAALTAVFVFLNDDYHFVQSSFAGLVFFAGAAYLWWVIRANAKGCMFGVSGKQVLYNAICAAVEVPLLAIVLLPDSPEGAKLAEGGALTDFAVVSAGIVLYAAAAVITLVVYFRERKRSR